MSHRQRGWRQPGVNLADAFDRDIGNDCDLKASASAAGAADAEAARPDSNRCERPTPGGRGSTGRQVPWSGSFLLERAAPPLLVTVH
jgi:hypothetical protein